MIIIIVNHIIIAVVIVIVKTIINCYSFDFIIIIINLYTINVCLQNSEVLNLPLSPIWW